jgi:tetratricopeptide (TPR) repeat protein
MDPESFARVSSLLRAANLVRTGGARGGDAIEPYHDRVREAVLSHLDESRRSACHELIALALEASTTSDPKALATHWRGAGQRERAAGYAIGAAEQASKALAFDRAAQWYEQAIELHESTNLARRELRVKLADAHANAGRGARAAEEYEAASIGANAAEALELRRRAAEQLLRSGHFDRGMAATKDVLSSVGMRLPSTPLRALILLVVWRVLLFMRGLRYKERDATQIPARELARIDTCWSLGVGMSLTDNIFGALFNTRTVFLALDAGEPHRIARALGLEIGFRGARGGPAWKKTQEVIRLASSVAEKTENAQIIAWVDGVSGVAQYLTGHFKHALELCDRAQSTLVRKGNGVAWEVASVRLFAMNALGQLGDLKEIVRRQPIQLREAEERGDLFAAVNLRIGYASLAWLVADDPDTALEQADIAMKSWSKRGFHIEHFYEMHARVNALLYAGRAKDALALVDARIPALHRSQLMRVQSLRLLVYALHARAALACGGDDALVIASRMAKKIAREHMAWATPLAHVLRAAVAHARGRTEEAQEDLREALSGFEASDMALNAAVARRCLGKLVGGERGEELVRAADTWMREQTVKRPDRICAMVAPGL